MNEYIIAPRFRLTSRGSWPVEKIARSLTRKQLDQWRMHYIRIHGMNIPQEINEALTSKHLKLKQRGE